MMDEIKRIRIDPIQLHPKGYTDMIQQNADMTLQNADMPQQNADMPQQNADMPQQNADMTHQHHNEVLPTHQHHNSDTTQQNPTDVLSHLAKEQNLTFNDSEFAKFMDSIDPLRSLRNEFFYPKMKDLPCVDLDLVDPDEDCIYFCGNSLGLQPRGVQKYIQTELDKWAKMGVYGHTEGSLPWITCDEFLEEDMATIVGAKRNEVTCMNGLSVNLHLALISFYQPTNERYKILIESGAFPSDFYVAFSQVSLHGRNPKECLIELKPREGEETLHHEDILDVIEREGASISVVLLPGVHYYTGQLFDIRHITEVAHHQGCYVGFDLAHAVGNVELHLHDWAVDFACWCSYKYMNSGAGGLAAFYIHEQHSNNNFPKLLGWWSHDTDTRFEMKNDLKFSSGAHVYRVSNPPPLLCCGVRASLDIFKRTSLRELRQKSLLLTAYLEALITERYIEKETNGIRVSLITPRDPYQRGAQLSLKFSVPCSEMFDQLRKRGIVCDVREPDVIRLAPVPLYCSFYDVRRFMSYLDEAVDSMTRLSSN